MMKKTIIASLMLAAMTMNAQNVIYVAPNGTGDGSSWENAMGSIPKAINEAKYDGTSAKEVWIQSGTYEVTKQITLQDSVNVYGGFAGTETTIDERAKGTKAWDYTHATILNGGDSVNIMAATKAMTTPIVVDGITFEHGAAFSAKSTNGGAIRLNTNVTLQNSIARNCYSNNAAGAVQIYPGGDVYNCYFENNLQETGSNGGGAITANNSSTGSEIRIVGCEFNGNRSSVRGGAINIQGGINSYIDRCVFYNNKGLADDGNTMKPGGAIYVNGNVTDITNCLMYNNTGTNTVYLKAKKFANNTIIKNVGGIYIAAGSNTAEVINNIVWADYADLAATATPTSISGTAVNGMKVMYNFTYNPIPTDKGWNLTDTTEVENTNQQFFSNLSNGDFVPKEGEEAPEGKIPSGPKFRKVTSYIGAIPMGLSPEDEKIFLDELTDSVNYRLNAASPCVNAGKELEYISEDLDGVSRPQGDRTDAGAYELEFYIVKMDNYDASLGTVYTEDGEEIAGETEIPVVRGGNLMLYFMANEDQDQVKLSKTLSTDGGLTYEGETSDITSEMDEEGRWESKIYQCMLLHVDWNGATGLENTKLQNGKAAKMLRNGQVVILVNDKIYNVQGVNL